MGSPVPDRTWGFATAGLPGRLLKKHKSTKLNMSDPGTHRPQTGLIDAMSYRLPLTLALLLAAFGAASGAHAHSSPNGSKTVLPVWNSASGKVEAVLVLEPTSASGTGGRFRFGSNSLDATFGLDAGDSLALLCDRKSGISSAIGNLANNCLLASLDTDGSPRRNVSASPLTHGGTRFGMGIGNGRDTLPAWLTPATGPTKVDVSDLTVFARKSLPREGYVSIAGTVAKARLVPYLDAQASGLLPNQFSTKSLSLTGGIGAFGANILGHVTNTPGQAKWEALGIGLTWRTPWSGQLSVGADNVITRGKNPFSIGATDDEQADDGAMPYIRYEQDL